MNPRANRWTYDIPLYLFCLTIFIAVLVPISSYDFWWHLTTGQIIMKDGLPATDPLSYTTGAPGVSMAEDLRFLLTRSWLAQCLFAVVHDFGGLDGIIYLRGLVFMVLGLFVVLMVQLFDAERGAALPLALLSVAAGVAVEDSDRPQMFSFLFAFLVVAIIDYAVQKKRPVLLYANTAVILVASNMHGGYLVAVLLPWVYAASAFFESRLIPLKRHLWASAALLFLVSGLNPNHWAVFGEIFAYASAGVEAVQEFRSPLTIFAYTVGTPSWTAYWAVTLGSLAAIPYLLAKKRYSHGLLLSCTLGASLFSMRYIFFFLPIATVFLSRFLQETVFARLRARPMLEVPLAVILLLAVIVNAPHPNKPIIRQALRPMSFPVGAADYLSSNPAPGNIFNLMSWGGYLEHRLWPGKKMFIDTRLWFSSALGQYYEILGYTAEGQALLDRYGITTVVLPAVDQKRGIIYPLAEALAGAPGWALVHVDGQAVVFTRREHASAALAPSEFYFEVLGELDYWRPFYPWLDVSYGRTSAAALQRIRSLP